MRELGVAQPPTLEFDVARRNSQFGSEDPAQLPAGSNEAAAVLLQSQTLGAPTFLVVEANAYLPDDVLLHIEHRCQDLQSIILENRHCDPGSQLDCFPIRQAKPKEVIPRRRCTQRW